MSTPFPDMDYWGSFMAMGPAPLGETSNPPDYGKDPLSTGPYMVDSFRPGEELTLVKNDQWDPNSDPARHQYADSFVFKFNQDQAQVDEIMLSGNTESQTSVSIVHRLGQLHQGRHRPWVTASCSRRRSASATITPDYTKITDIEVRKALAYAYPYETSGSPRVRFPV